MGMIPEEEVRSGQQHATRHHSKRPFWSLSGRAPLKPFARVEPAVLPGGTNENGALDGNDHVTNTAEEPGLSDRMPVAEEVARGVAESLVEPSTDATAISAKLVAATSYAQPPFLHRTEICDMLSDNSVFELSSQVTATGRKVPSMSHVRDVHQQNLLKEMYGELEEPMMIADDSENSRCCTSMCIWNVAQKTIFCSCGVLPWSLRQYPMMSFFYQCFVLLLVTTVTAFCCWNLWGLSLKGHDDVMSLTWSIDTVLALGCTVSLATCGALWKSTVMVEACGLLRAYTSKNMLWSQVKDSCLWDMSMTLTCWFMALAMRVAVHTEVHADSAAETFSCLNWLSFPVFTIVSGILIGLVSFTLYLCRCMMTMVDNFSLMMNNHQQFGASLQEWNLLQSVHRNTCQAIQIPFMVMQTTAMVVCILVIQEAIRPLEGDRLLAMCPGLLVALAIFSICIYAGVLTDRCTRLPILISGLGLKNKNGEGLNLNWERLYAVSFISTNQAGFFVCEVRVTSAMVCKTAYVVGAVAFALVSSQK